jgi:hypothetical protein
VSKVKPPQTLEDEKARLKTRQAQRILDLAAKKDLISKKW